MYTAKGNNGLYEFRYVIGVDLASYKTGVCIYDIATKKFVLGKEIEVKKNSQNKNIDLYILLSEFFEKIRDEYDSGDFLLVKEAMPSQHGKFTTVSTLQSLAQAHAILDMAVWNSAFITPYDDKGIHPITVRSLFRTEAITHPSKEDVRKELVRLYDLDDDELTDNISDSMAVVHTLINKQWNADIAEMIKEQKKAVKLLKQTRAIDEHKRTIDFLNLLKI